MIKIYIANIQKMDEDIYLKYLSLLPPFIQQEVRRYQQLSDRYRTLLGKIILHRYLQKYSNFSLNDVIKNKYGKPYIKEWNTNFNISHSEDYVVCGFNTKGNIGIDIEKNKQIEFEHFKNIFSSTEWNKIETASNPIEKFYQCWTLKEAFLKYLGTGFLKSVDYTLVSKTKLLFDNQFHSYESFLYQDYTLSIVKPELSTKIRIVTVKL